MTLQLIASDWKGCSEHLSVELKRILEKLFLVSAYEAREKAAGSNRTPTFQDI